MGRDKRIIKDANKQIKRLQGKIDNFEWMGIDDAAEQGIVNPYGDVTNAFSDVTNPFAALDNAYADVTNTAADLQNPFADLRVNTQAAEFQAEQNAQSQANILDALIQGGASAGASATALASQATNANAQIAADIAQQEQQNQQLSAQGEAQRQQAFAAGEARRQELFGQGLAQQQQLQGQGDQWAQQMRGEGQQFMQQLQGQGNQFMQELLQARSSTELEGLYTQQGQQFARQKAAQDRRAQRFSSIVQGVTSLAGSALSAGSDSILGKFIGSDPRLKEDIKRVGTSPSGIPIYEFKYIGEEGVYQGAMSNEVPADAVVKNFIGDKDGVDYSKIDVEFIKIA